MNHQRNHHNTINASTKRTYCRSFIERKKLNTEPGKEKKNAKGVGKCLPETITCKFRSSTQIQARPNNSQINMCPREAEKRRTKCCSSSWKRRSERNKLSSSFREYFQKFFLLFLTNFSNQSSQHPLPVFCYLSLLFFVLSSARISLFALDPAESCRAGIPNIKSISVMN